MRRRAESKIHDKMKEMQNDIGFWKWLCDESLTDLVAKSRNFGYTDNVDLEIEVYWGRVRNNRVELLLYFYPIPVGGTRIQLEYAKEFWKKLPFNLKKKLLNEYKDLSDANR